MPKPKNGGAKSKVKKKPIKKSASKKKSSKKKSPKLKNHQTSFYFKGLDNRRYHVTKRQRLFCEYFLNPHITNVQAATKAGYALKKGKVNYSLAATIASENLKKPNICAYIALRFKDCGMTDELIEKHHFYTVTQFDNLQAKNKAIELYYKKSGAFAPEKIEHSINEKLEKFLEKQSKKLL